MPTPAEGPIIPQIFTAISSAISQDSLTREILRFLLANENAMDTAKGIAAWWVHTDELAVQPSLHRLVACGAVLPHTLSSGTTLYRLTQDVDVRAWLRAALTSEDDRDAPVGRSAKNGKFLAETRIA